MSESEMSDRGALSEGALSESALSEERIQRCAAMVESMREQISRSVVGQGEVVEQVLTAFLAGGHVLVEGLPGLGKTLLVRSLAKTFGGASARIQFTPDLMPTDITGHVIFNMKSGVFETRKGPVFTNLLIADEINRAPAKTQAAMLEVMQEGQVSLEGEPLPLRAPFMTMATQNPLEHEGTYPLPDAQLDRFLLKIHIGYPSAEEEVDIVERITTGRVGDLLSTEEVQTVTTPEEVIEAQKIASEVAADRRVVDYAVRVVRQTRDWPGIATGAGPRGSLALIRAARVCALVSGRGFVIPDDIKQVALPALRHRIVLTPEMEIEGRSGDRLLEELLETVEAPRT